MTSRVEAVITAATKKVVALKCGEAFCFITDEQWEEIIQAAIEASDAWLRDQGGHVMVDVKCDACGASGVRREDLTHSDYWMHCTVCGSSVERIDQ